MIVAASTVWTVDRVDGQFVLARRPSFAPLSSALATCTTTPRHHCVLNQYYWYGDLSTVLLYGGLVCLLFNARSGVVVQYGVSELPLLVAKPKAGC